MSNSNMNFGPEWMRRLSRANSAQNLETLGNNMVSGTGSDGPASPTGSTDKNSSAPSTSYSSVTSKQKAEAARLALETTTSAECLNPFLYTREYMLSLYRPSAAPLDFESHEYVHCEEPLPPMAHFPLSEAESALLASGHVNSTARRNPSGPYPPTGAGPRGAERQHSRDGLSRGREKSGIRSAGTKINNSPWASAGKNSLGSFGADGVFRLDGASDLVLDQRDYERLEAERLAQHLAYAAGSDSHAFANAELVAQLNQARYAAGEEPIPLDPSGVAPAKGRGSLKNILAGLAGFDIDDPEASPNPNETSNWLYKDPTGTIQGPFTSFDMHEWYRLGYFVGDLLVRREEESTFEPLAILISRVGDDEAPFLTPPRSSHLRTILTPRSARGFVGSGFEPDSGLGFPYAQPNPGFGLSGALPSALEQSRLGADFGGGLYNESYASQVHKAALFQEAALYQAQQERQQYLQLLQRQQQAVMAGYNSLYGMSQSDNLGGFHPGFDQESLRMAYQSSLNSGLSESALQGLQNLQARQEILQNQQGWGKQSQEAPSSAGLEPWKDLSNQMVVHPSVEEVTDQIENLNVQSSSPPREVEVEPSPIKSQDNIKQSRLSANSNSNSNSASNTNTNTTSPAKAKSKPKKNSKKPDSSPPLPGPTTPEIAPAPWSGASKPAKSFIQIQQEEAAERARVKAAASNEGAKRYADTVVKSGAPSWGPTRSGQASPTVSKATVPSRPDSNSVDKKPIGEPKRTKPQINPQQPPPPSDKFITWCKSMLKHLDVKVDDVLSMLTGFPLDPPSDFHEIVQELFHDQHHTPSGIDPSKFAEEFIIRRKVDCGVLDRSALPSPGLQPPSPVNTSFQVVAKKNRKKTT